MNGSAVHSRAAAWVTVQVYVTLSPGQAVLPFTVEFRVVAVFKAKQRGHFLNVTPDLEKQKHTTIKR